MSKTKKIEEQFVNPQGYLRLPKAFRQKYGPTKTLPNPAATVVEKDGEIGVIYKWKSANMPGPKDEEGNQ